MSPKPGLQDPCGSSTRRISTAGGTTRISLKECIQLAVSKPDPALTELVELIKAIQLDLELQRGTAMAAGQRHQQPGRETGLPGGLDLASDQVDRTLAVDRQHIVGKAGKIHGDPPGMDQVWIRPAIGLTRRSDWRMAVIITINSHRDPGCPDKPAEVVAFRVMLAVMRRREGVVLLQRNPHGDGGAAHVHAWKPRTRPTINCSRSRHGVGAGTRLRAR
jgi:hypothetical protein